MTVAETEIAEKVLGFLGRIKRNVEITLDTPLYGEGLGMDSLQTAELSALLEDEFGRDPYSRGVVPRTAGEIAAWYSTAT